MLTSLRYTGALLRGATQLRRQSSGAGSTFGAGSGASPRWVLRIEESSSYLQEVCNYSVLRQKAPEQERIASTLSIEIQVFNQQ